MEFFNPWRDYFQLASTLLQSHLTPSTLLSCTDTGKEENKDLIENILLESFPKNDVKVNQVSTTPKEQKWNNKDPLELKDKQLRNSFEKIPPKLVNGVPCSFCRKNGEQKHFYSSHSLKDGHGQVICPVLQKYVCPCCKATGSKAHTLMYCPRNTKYISAAATYFTPRMSSGRKRSIKI